MSFPGLYQVYKQKADLTSIYEKIFSDFILVSRGRDCNMRYHAVFNTTFKIAAIKCLDIMQRVYNAYYVDWKTFDRRILIKM